MARGQIGWTGEEKERLMELLAEGWTPSAAARALNRPLSSVFSIKRAIERGGGLQHGAEHWCDQANRLATIRLGKACAAYMARYHAK